MSKYLKYLFLLALAVMLAGCIPTATATPAPVENPTQAPVVDTPTSAPQVIYVTATPSNQTGVEAASTATPAALEATPTPTPSDASLTISGVDDLGGGRAVIHWAATGNFPTGYIVVYSDTNQSPTFPVNTYNYTGDPNARSAMITVEVGKIYYVRVCRYTNNTCDVYSNLGVFALQNVAPTSYPNSSGYYPTATSSSIAYNSDGEVISSSSTLAITSMNATDTGKAIIRWTASGTFSKGFAIVFSTSYTKPFVGGYPYYVVGDSAARSAYVDGTPGSTVYYRICRYTGTTCDIYSAPFTFTFPGTAPTAVPATPTSSTPTTVTPVTPTPATATPTPTATVTSTPVTPTADPTADSSTLTLDSVTNKTDLGAATASWSYTGTFPSGILVLYSSTNSEPTISDTTILVSNVGDGSTDITGGIPGTTYHVRLCKYDGAACLFYSNTQDITFTADTATISLDSVVDTTDDTATVSWTPTGDFANGYRLLVSETHNPADLSSEIVQNITDPATHTATFTAVAGSTYHVRVCKIFGDSCSVYSNQIDFTKAQIVLNSVTDVSSGNATAAWTATGTFGDGFLVVYSASNTLPTELDTPVSAASGATSAAITGTAGTAYYVRVCKLSGSACVVYSNAIAFTFAKITLGDFTMSTTDETEGYVGVTAAGNYPYGFMYLISPSNDTPLITDSSGTLSGHVDGDNTITSVTITNLIPGGTYYFRLCQQASSTPSCLIYSDVKTLDIPSSLVLDTPTGGEGAVELTWGTPGSGFPAFSTYQVMRIRSDETTFTSLGSVASSVHSYTDTTAVSGATYHYSIYAYSGSNLVGTSNEEVYAVP
jgi:cell division septation protein DedD